MNPHLSLAEIKLEKLQIIREMRAEVARLDLQKARSQPGWESPGTLAQMLDPTIVQTPALELIDRELVQLADDPTRDRLMVFMSPQEGKSERVSHRLPEWLLKFNPDLRIAIVSYADEMARRWGADIKSDIETFNGDDGTVDLGIRLKEDSRAAGRWHVRGYKGGVYCCGIAGSLTGKPVDWVIVDDPIKDMEQANSIKYRDRWRRFWRAVIVPRLGPGSKIVIIQTRWHQDDASGWLLTEQPDRWRVVSIPARAGKQVITQNPDGTETSVWEHSGPDPLGREPGEAMISARGDRDWDGIRRDVGEYVWNALYMQRPTPAEGGMFKRHWWQIYESPKWVERPDGTRWIPGADEVIQSWDCAFKDLDDSDFVCGQVWARFGIQAYLVDQVHDRMDFVTTLQSVREVTARWPQAVSKYIEDKANGTAVINMLSATIPGIIAIEPDGTKIARARAVTPFVESGQAYLPAPELAPWVGDFIDEHALFPNSTNDDRVDAMSQAFNRMLLNPILSGNTILQPEDLDDDLSDGTISRY